MKIYSTALLVLILAQFSFGQTLINEIDGEVYQEVYARDIRTNALTASVNTLFEETNPQADEVEETPESDWTFHIDPYMWLPALDVTSTIAGVSADIDLSFGDILDNFDVIAISGRFELWHKKKWGFLFDGLYIDLSTDDLSHGGALPPIFSDTLGIDITQIMIDMGVGYRILELPLDQDNPNGKRLIFEAHGGLRYMYLKQEVKVSLAAPGSGSRTVGGSEDWVEPWIGGRILLPVNDWFLLMVRGSVGGFGIGSASELTWDVVIGSAIKINDNILMQVGYRYFDMDYSRYSGSEEFGFDGSMDGPWLGVMIRF